MFISALAVRWRIEVSHSVEIRPDAMIVDRLLPGMDGLTVIEALRKDQVRTPVLVLSALGAGEALQTRGESGIGVVHSIAPKEV